MSTFNQGIPSVPSVISASNVFMYGNTTSGTALSVQQLGAGGAVASFSNATGSVGLFVSSTGQVGVGTASPQNTFQVGAPVSGIVYGNNPLSQSNVIIFGNSPSMPTTAGTGTMGGTLFVNSTNANASNVGASIALGGRGQDFGGGQQHMTFARIQGTQAVTNGAYYGNFVVETQNSGSLYERMRIDQNGNVGIGLTNPSFGLDVYGTSSTAGTIRALTTSQGSGVAGSQLRLMEASDSYGFAFQNINALRLGLLYYNGAAGVECMSVRRDNGNVGIGTTSPTQILDVYGGANTTLRIRSSATGATRNVGISLENSNSTMPSGIYLDAADKMAFYTFGGARMSIDYNGYVGIGTTSPSYILHVNTTATTGQNIASFFSPNLVGGGQSLNILLGTGQAVGQTGVITYLNFGTNSTNVLQMSMYGVGGSSININQTGVGIGTTNPGYTLQVGSASGSTNLNGCLWINPNADGDQRHYFSAAVSTVGIGTNADARLNIQDRAGIYVRFFTGSGTSVTLYGSITQSGGTTLYNASSDYRLKSNVVPLANALSVINSLRPVSFTFDSHPESVQAGFIAHEVQAIIPECITGVKDAVADDGSILPQGIDKSYIVSYLTKAVQELSGTVNSQAATIASLEQSLSSLEQSLESAQVVTESLSARLAAAGL